MRSAIAVQACSACAATPSARTASSRAAPSDGFGGARGAIGIGGVDGRRSARLSAAARCAASAASSASSASARRAAICAGRGLQDRVLGSRPRPAAAVSSPTRRPASAARCAQSARSAAIARSPRGASRMLAGQRFAFGTRRGIRRPGRGQRGASGLDRPAQRVQVGQRVPRIARLRERGVRVVALDSQALDPRIDGGEPRGDLRCLGAQLLVRRARALQVLLGLAACRRAPAARRSLPPGRPRLRRRAA